MSAFLVFDVQDSLIFWHCEPKFLHFLVQNKWPENESSISQHDETVRNLLTIHLTPWMSYIRTVSANGQLSPSTPTIDLPHTRVAHTAWQQFMFVHLEHRNSSAETEEEISFRLQRKVNVFRELVLFLYGNAVHCIDKYELSLRILMKMLNKWDSVSFDVPFLIESVERLFLGFHLEDVCKQVVARAEQLMKLEMYRQLEEMPTCYLIMYKDRLVYIQESANNSHLNHKDLLSVLLLSSSIELSPPWAGDLSSEDSNFDESLTADKCVGSYFQHLVFLKSCYSQQIPLPHIYRKVMISQELYFVSLTQISSILTISLPTLIESISELKQNLHLQELSSRKELDKLTNCLRQLVKYINRNVQSIMPKQSLHVAALEQLQEIAKKSTNQPTALIIEQADRILALVLRSIQDCYAEVAFKELYLSIFPTHIRHFEAIVCEMSELLHETFAICLDYIQVKSETNALVLGSACDYMDLETFIFIDRLSGQFVHGQLHPSVCHSSELLPRMILKGYSNQSLETQQLVVWSEDCHRFVYFCMDEQNQNVISPGTCDIAHVLKKMNALDERQGEVARASGNTKVIFELFCIFKASTLNEQISHNNIMTIVKLIKLYKNG